MRVEYIQPVCPYCAWGLSVTPAEDDVPQAYHCHEHGDIEPRLVRYVLAAEVDGSVLLPAAYKTMEAQR